jgi:hypothetical protein
MGLQHTKCNNIWRDTAEPHKFQCNSHWLFNIPAYFKTQNSLKCEQNDVDIAWTAKALSNLQNKAICGLQTRVDRITENKYLKFASSNSNRSFCLLVLSNKYWITPKSNLYTAMLASIFNATSVERENSVDGWACSWPNIWSNSKVKIFVKEMAAAAVFV